LVGRNVGSFRSYQKSLRGMSIPRVQSVIDFKKTIKDQTKRGGSWADRIHRWAKGSLASRFSSNSQLEVPTQEIPSTQTRTREDFVRFTSVQVEFEWKSVSRLFGQSWLPAVENSNFEWFAEPWTLVDVFSYDPVPQGDLLEGHPTRCEWCKVCYPYPLHWPEALVNYHRLKRIGVCVDFLWANARFVPRNVCSCWYFKPDTDVSGPESLNFGCKRCFEWIRRRHEYECGCKAE